LAGLATIYADNQGATPLTNPFQVDTNGKGFFYAASGLYTVVANGGTLASPVVYINQNLLLAAGGGAVNQVNGTSLSSQSLLNLVQGANITLSASGGNVTINGTAAATAFKVNSSTASSQTVQNLIAGTGLTITDGGSGNITFASTSALALKVNGTANSSQSVLNLIAGANVSITDGGSGAITIAASLPAFQTNSAPLASAATVNFQQGSGIVITNPSAGIVNIASSLSSLLQTQTVTLTAAQIIALNATPVQLVAAPGAGLINIPLSMVFEFDAVPVTSPPSTGAFAGVHTADLSVYYNTTKVSNLKGDSTGLLDQTAQTFEQAAPATTTIFSTSAQAVNQAVMLYNNGTAYTGGGASTLNVTVFYATVAV
jgi:hypothetical protein